jgi:hypothetical protein
VGNSNDDQGDEEPEPVASLTGDAMSGTRIEQHASVPLRRVRAGELRWEEFLYELKAGSAGGRLRRPSSAGSDTTATGQPASPSRQVIPNPIGHRRHATAPGHLPHSK